MITKRELQKQGFRVVPGFDALYLNRTGQAYDFNKKRLLSINPRKRIVFRDKSLNIPKLLLVTFAGLQYQNNKHVRYIDGNKNNISVENLCYTPDKSELQINYADLMTAIRCYFQVPKRYKVADKFMTGMYLSKIVSDRDFIYHNRNLDNINIFEAYIDTIPLSLIAVATQYRTSAWLFRELVNPFVKKLVNEILTELEKGELQILDYKPRKKTTAQMIKEYKDHLIQNGLESTIKIPKKRSAEQMAIDYKEKLKRFQKGDFTQI